ncbi:hypothetical protein PYCCODRAFT_1390492 [Trametes coccinea BRFM310]|uniref:C3H1-type domain-containing protein n=1 Tax=Trametes coccinea (strain BRFM310) TaxID=1353009 RepID=A0A1Y2INS7_TRAC3|nr:hypothetical protein PYCCODRAFT_1390492 [Trametes coccinea BRFM310]
MEMKSASTSGAPAATEPPSVPKPKILILSLEKESYSEEIYQQLYRALRKNASVTEVTTLRAANRALSSGPRPSAILVSDAAITSAKHGALLNRLIDYAREGGRVVLGMQLSNHFPLGSVGSFFRKWGLRWDHGSYHRTTFALNPAGVPPPLTREALLTTYSMKALHLKNVSRECAVYLPTPDSRVESMVYGPTPITGDKANETPAAFTRVGQGYLGYIGDVNGEQGSTRLTLEMCGVAVAPGDLGRREVITGIVFHANGRREVSSTVQEEIPLPRPAPAPHPSASASASTPATKTSSKGKKLSPLAAAFVPSAAATSASTATPAPARSPPRPREAEVAARAVQRAKVREEKTKKAEALKEEGNALFKKGDWAEAAEKYREAAMIAGPQPVFMSNLAAALLKLELWDLAESAASRALAYDRKHLKALFRRAVARKEMHTFDEAESDLRRILAEDPTNASARSELAEVGRLRRIYPCEEGCPELDEVLDDVNVELEDESDSEDFRHTGNNVPCKHYNHNGCTRGTQCRFSHAPDEKSVRDELGRNVCIYWLFGDCRFGDKRCVYAHDRTYLPERGWWNDEERYPGIKQASQPGGNGRPRSLAAMEVLAETVKPDDWRVDLWVDGGYAEEAHLQKVYGNYWAGDEDEGAWVDEDDDGGEWTDEEGSLEREMEERSMYCGYTRDQFEELLCQGIKPWDEW